MIVGDTHITSAIGKCFPETNPIPGFQQRHARASKCHLFADDSIIYSEVKFNTNCDQLPQDLDNLHEWETLWAMSFNP